MAKIRGAVVVNEERCKGCNLCGGMPHKNFVVTGKGGERPWLPLCLHV